MKMIWAEGSVRMPSRARIVVWGRGETGARDCSSQRLMSVDLPTFGGPTTATYPERNGTTESEEDTR
jgi:hypothetical protein